MVAPRLVGSSAAAGFGEPPAFSTPVTEPSSCTIHPTRAATPLTLPRPSYSPAGDATPLAEKGHSLPSTVTVPNEALSSSVAVMLLVLPRGGRVAPGRGPPRPPPTLFPPPPHA